MSNLVWLAQPTHPFLSTLPSQQTAALRCVASTHLGTSFNLSCVFSPTQRVYTLVQQQQQHLTFCHPLTLSEKWSPPISWHWVPTKIFCTPHSSPRNGSTSSVSILHELANVVMSNLGTTISGATLRLGSSSFASSYLLPRTASVVLLLPCGSSGEANLLVICDFQSGKAVRLLQIFRHQP